MARSDGGKRYVVIAQHDGESNTIGLVGSLRQWGRLQKPSVVCATQQAQQAGLPDTLSSVLFGGDAVVLSVAKEQPDDWWTEATRSLNARTTLCVLPGGTQVEEVAAHFVQQGAAAEKGPGGLSVYSLP